MANVEFMWQDHASHNNIQHDDWHNRPQFSSPVSTFNIESGQANGNVGGRRRVGVPKSRGCALLWLLPIAAVVVLVLDQFLVPKQWIRQRQPNKSSQNDVAIEEGLNSSSTVLGNTTYTSAAATNIEHDDTESPSSSGNLWLFVSSWNEGMSSWLISMSEILVLARRLNATVVEPCLENGKLISCRGAPDIVLKFGDVFNLTRLRHYHEHFVTHEVFLNRTTTAPVFQLCMADENGSPPWQKQCGHLNSTGHGRTRSQEVVDALTAANKGDSVLEVTSYRRGGFSRMTQGKNLLISADEVRTVKRDSLRFRENHFEFAEELLQRMGIAKHTPFSVIQWRGELPDLDYLGCARDVVRTRDAMNHQGNRYDNPDFVLMSSLNTNVENMWKGVRRKISSNSSAAGDALQLLLDSGFQKIDTVVEDDEVIDPGLLAVWDVIIAMKAEDFATCTGSCPDFCSRCNWRGNFSRLPVELREGLKKTSMQCWPQPSTLPTHDSTEDEVT